MYKRMSITRVARLATVGVVAAGSLALAGCGSSKSSSGSSGTASASTKTASSASSAGGSSSGGNKKLVLIPGETSDNFYVTMGCGAKAEAQKLGYSLNIQGSQTFEAPEQIPIVSSVTASKPAAVLIAPTDAHALIAPMQNMKKAGIKVIQVDTSVDNDAIAAASITSNNVEGGELAAKYLAAQLHGKGTVVVMNEQAGVSTTMLRIKGFLEQIKKYPGITALPTQYVGDNPAKAASAITALYSAHSTLAGVFATNVLVAQGVGTGLKTAGGASKVKMVGYDADPTQIQQLNSGVVQALVAQAPYQEGVDGVQQAVNALEGKPAKSMLTGLKVLTKGNLAANEKWVYHSSC